MVDLDKVSLKDLVPSSIINDAQIRAATIGIDPELRLIGGAVGEVLLLSRVDELPEGVVDLLAWQYHCDFYSDSLTLEQKRNLVRDSILWHRKKGTKWAVMKVLENLGIKAEVTEWFENGAAPYTFNVAVTFPNDPDKTFSFMDSEVEQLIRDAINEAKPVHADVFSLVAKDEKRDPNHICFWDICNYEHGLFKNLSSTDGCIITRPDNGELLHFGIENEYSNAVSVLRYTAWDVSLWDDLPPDTGSSIVGENAFCFEVTREGGECNVTFRNFPISMATWDDALFDGVQVMEPTMKTGGWSGKWDAGARFDDENYLPYQRRMVTKFLTDSPCIELDLRESGFNPTVENFLIIREYALETDCNVECEISVQQFWEIYETWRSRKIWSSRSWHSNVNPPNVTENNFESEVLSLTVTSEHVLFAERQHVPSFDVDILDGAPPEFLPDCVTITQI